MMSIEDKIISAVKSGVKALYGEDIANEQIQLQKTKKEFEGHLTVVVFPFVPVIPIILSLLDGLS